MEKTWIIVALLAAGAESEVVEDAVCILADCASMPALSPLPFEASRGRRSSAWHQACLGLAPADGAALAVCFPK